MAMAAMAAHGGQADNYLHPRPPQTQRNNNNNHHHHQAAKDPHTQQHTNQQKEHKILNSDLSLEEFESDGGVAYADGRGREYDFEFDIAAEHAPLCEQDDYYLYQYYSGGAGNHHHQ